MNPERPTVALTNLSDLSQTLTLVGPYCSLDLHSMLNAALARQGGAIAAVPPGVVLPDREGRNDASRPEGIALDVAAAARAAEDEEADRAAGLPQAPKSKESRMLLGRLKAWLILEVGRVQKAGGAVYSPGRRAFAPSVLLDATQFAALAKILGGAAMRALDDVLLMLAGEATEAIYPMLIRNREPLGRVALEYAEITVCI